MNADEMNRAVSEACGFKPEIEESFPHRKIWRGVHPLYPQHGKLTYTAEDLPDYAHDLNAMHEAEKVLDVLQQNKYHDFLSMDCRSMNEWLYHATAAQRAEAFLKTIGKWKDSCTPRG